MHRRGDDRDVGTTATIDDDLPCAGCGYNLRTLPGDRACPECGGSVARSAWLHLVRTSELGVLRLVDARRLDVWRLAIATSLVAWGVGCFSIPFGAFVGYGPVAATIVGLPPVTCLTLAGYAAWRMVSHERRALRLPVRIGVALGLAAVGLLFVNDRWAIFYEPLLLRLGWNPSDGALAATRAVGHAFAFAWPATTFVVTCWIAGIAWVARRPLLATAIAVPSLLSAGFAATLATTVSPGHWGEGCARFLLSLHGPTGVAPAVGIYDGISNLRDLANTFSLWSVRHRIDRPHVGVALQVVMIVGHVMLCATLSRALRLGTLPAAPAETGAR